MRDSPSEPFHKRSKGIRISEQKYDAVVLEGSWSAVVDLFQGAADMIELVAKTAYQLIIANPGAVKAMLMEWVDKLRHAWASRSTIADDFMQKWESDDDWTRGNFQGEVLGWVMMTALLIMATGGVSAFAAATGRWASILRLLASIEAFGDLTTYLAKLGRLPGKVSEVLRSRFGKEVAEAAAEGSDTEGVATRAISGISGAEDAGRRGKKGNKPKMETITESLDGHEIHNDFRKLSGPARHVVRQLEERGWVRVSEISPEALVEVSKWFGKEIAVLQSPYGRLRVVLGSRNGIARALIPLCQRD